MHLIATARIHVYVFAWKSVLAAGSIAIEMTRLYGDKFIIIFIFVCYIVWFHLISVNLTQELPLKRLERVLSSSSPSVRGSETVIPL